ncbi:Na+/solute symporter [Ameyamaea chiangmaiensis NBRC 103196]|uniref:Sodium:solute symporter n=1 Tax=Ameyamaea chiangmaiensis TaxID=442969 RepID=A0A850PAW9_9PROT|nr:sodium:solute symporter [Ameyamaea chiangmaiensis]MBS4075197.1 sodium:solute symporter [Ameyamaea chiangmaiensis]NVN41214.1 sodium:solute symporter [Ameyamaea chiangmaiensis]GBQ66376.1 Na+/solute symporter [Ameyamaea chiangmaiensis NBRC 103196]
MASAVFAFVILLSLGIALASRRGHGHQDSRDFFVASGQFGGVLALVLAVGETYSAGSILGFPAAAYGQGTGFVLWFLGYILLAYPIGYVINPLLWRAGRRHGALTAADLFRAHFDSRGLERLIVANAILFMLPLGELQFAGLLTVMGEFPWHIPSIVLSSLAGVLTFLWLMISGIRAPAYVSIIKDVLIVVAVVLVGAAALHAMGALDHPLAALPPARPITGREQSYDISTILLQAMGFCAAPQTVSFLFTARSGRILRRNQIIMPLYMLMFPLLYCVALYAHAVHLPLASANAVFLTSARALLPGWATGLVAGACALSALVILASICLAIGPLVSHNLLHGLSDRQQQRGAKAVIATYLVFSILAAAHLSGFLVTLTSLYYLGIAQMVPGLALIAFGQRPRALAVGMGLVAGDVVAVGLSLAGQQPLGLNPGLIGLCVNLALLAVLWKHPRQAGALRDA